MRSLRRVEQPVELGAEMRDRTRFVGCPALVQREGHAPDLLALLLAQIVEELDEAGDQVGLGEDGIDRHPHAKLVVQLAHAPADGAGMRMACVIVESGEIGQADRDDHAVERLAAAVLLQQAQEAEPAGAVHAGVAVLRGVAPGRVDQSPPGR